MKFEKYHGLGNDFIIFNIKDLDNVDSNSELAKKVCNRNFGIGADGMMVYSKNPVGIITMDFYNSDGSSAPMCGNGIRCFTHFLYENSLTDSSVTEIKTGAGVLTVEKIPHERDFLVKVNMGTPLFSPSQIPVNSDSEDFLNKKVQISGNEITLSSLFMGTTHTVVFADFIDENSVKTLGPAIEKNQIFPKYTNVNFVRVISKDKLEVTTWERGAGLTFACGTGACASVVIGNRLGMLGNAVTVDLPGGSLRILIDSDIYMIGPSIKVASGEYFFNR